MKKEDIHFDDIHRWLFGPAPAEFMFEVAIRTLLVYLCLLLTVRLLGKRMSSQMTITELSVMVTLGAIVSPAMQIPERGIFFGVVGLSVALIFQRGLNLWAFRNPKVEKLTQGEMMLIIKDGILLVDQIQRIKFSKQEIFAILRTNNINNLAMVKRGYLESCGILSIFEEKETRPGLSVFPKHDTILTDMFKEAPDKQMACTNCGHVQKIENPVTACELCRASAWINAYVSVNPQ